MSSGKYSRFRDDLFQPVDIAPLVFFRVAFAAMLVIEMLRYVIPGSTGVSWVQQFWILPRLHFAYEGFEWIRPWPGLGMNIHFLAVGGVALLVLLGFWYRVSAVLLFLGFSTIFLMDKTLYLNHFYLYCLLSFLLMFLPAGRAFSLDSRRNPSIRSTTAPAWTLWILWAQIGLVYFYGGVAKLDADWLQGAPVRAMLADRSEAPLVGPYVQESWLIYLVTYGGLFLDLLVTPFLLWRKTRRYAFAAAVAFHVTNSWLFSIGTFPWVMIVATMLFLPEPLRRLLDWLRPDSQRQLHKSALLADPSPLRRRVTLAFLALYLAIQVVVPLRHHWYPGYTSWTERGHRFSWRMMLRHKEPVIQLLDLRLIDPASGQSWEVDPEQYLSAEEVRRSTTDPKLVKKLRESVAKDWQDKGYSQLDMRGRTAAVRFTITTPERSGILNLSDFLPEWQGQKMAIDPGLIVQFSRWLAKEVAGPAAEVRAEVWVQLNGRKAQLLLDPQFDLMQVQGGRGPAPWILPLAEPLP
ncbi:MAG: HTTM domain-containing protein [Planctomycetota bacterium]